MKKILLLITGLVISFLLLAQHCGNYLYLQKDKTIEMTGFNKKGDVTMKSVAPVSNVNTSGGLTTANVVSQVYVWRLFDPPLCGKRVKNRLCIFVK